MKKKGIIFIIISLSLVLLLNIVPLFSYAGNGQSSYWVGNGNRNVNPSYGFKNTSLYVTDESQLKFSLHLGAETSSNYANLYLCSVSMNNGFHTYSVRPYVEYVHEVDLLNLQDTYYSGQHTIDIKSMRLPVGTYKLVAIVGEDTISTCHIYEYYFLYCGFIYEIQDIGGATVHGDYYSVQEYEGNTLVDYPINRQPYAGMGNVCSYTGTMTPLTDGVSSISVRVSLGQWNISTLADPDYYDIDIKELSFNATTNDGAFFTANYCSIYLYNATKRVSTYLGTINNIARDTQTSGTMSYVISFPANLVSQDDQCEVGFYYYYKPDTQHTGNTFDYSFRVNVGAMYAYKDPSNSQYFGSLDKLGEAGDALSNVERPEINFDDLDIKDIIGSDSISSASAYFESLYQFEIIGIMLMVVAILVLLSYLFFGKK